MEIPLELYVEQCEELNSQALTLFSRIILGRHDTELGAIARAAKAKLKVACDQLRSLPGAEELSKKRGVVYKVTTFLLSLVGLDHLMEPDHTVDQTEEINYLKAQLVSQRKTISRLAAEVKIRTDLET